MESQFEEMKRFVEFTENDSRTLAAFHPMVLRHLPAISEQFYARLQRHPGAHEVFTGPEQIRRLKATLQEWADRLFAGPHDETYFDLRSRIGRVHVRIGLRQMYMLTGMNILRESLRRVVFEELAGQPERIPALISALHKIIDLDLAIMLDTYREEFVEKLGRSEQQAAIRRLAAIGEVVASVAHEVRNPLAGISGAVEVLRDDLPSASPRREIVSEVLAQIRRLDERVRDLLVYSRKVSLNVESVEPAVLIQSTLALLSEEPLLREVETHVAVAPRIGTHPMDRGQMQEVLVNLIRNAATAMEGTGALYIQAERREGGVLALIVEDTGPGVPPEKLEEIFTPFVTTRPEGTGLGLAIARRTLEAHGGSLVCQRGARGARFVASLPPLFGREG